MNTPASPGRPLWQKLLIAALLLLVLLFAASLVFIRSIGAWHLLFPSHAHEITAPEIQQSLPAPAVLLFTKTNSFRHIEGIAAGLELLDGVAERRGWSTFHTENSAVFNAQDLARFNAVVFLNTSGDTLSPQQQQAFQTWLGAGGGWLGIHAAGDGSHKDWPWYLDNLIGADFTAHIMGPQFQLAEVEVEAPDHAAMQQLPSSWQHEEEWYSWEESPRGKGFEILATIDEDSYSPWARFLGQEKDLRMGDHPVVWSRCFDGGRAIYSAMGHSAESFANPQHQLLLENALDWALGAAGQLCGD